MRANLAAGPHGDNEVPCSLWSCGRAEESPVQRSGTGLSSEWDQYQVLKYALPFQKPIDTGSPFACFQTYE
jgi:hypothetical protein